jgi:pectate lyase
MKLLTKFAKPSGIKLAVSVMAVTSLLLGCGGGGGGTPATTTSNTPTVQPQADVPVPPSSGSSSASSVTSSASSPSAPASSASTPSTPITYSRVVNWNRTETPAKWDFQGTKPSRSACGTGEGVTVEVGPGKAKTKLSQVNWIGLMPCDIVKVYYDPAGYHDIVVMVSRGDPNKWITLEGVPDPVTGAKPFLDGVEAKMPVSSMSNSNFDSNGLLIIHGPPSATVPNLAVGFHPGYLHVSGFKFQNAKMSNFVTTLSGVRQNWWQFTSGIAAYGVQHFAVDHCEFANNGLGLYINSTGDDLFQSRDILVSHNYFHDNGNVGTFGEHNAYTESIGIIYEYNYFGPITAGSNGLNIKERSPGLVFRYNYVHNGSYLLGLMDPDSNPDYERLAVDSFNEDLNSMVYLYSNIFVVDTPAGYTGTTPPDAPLIVQHGAGGGVSAWNPQIRYGTVYFYNNRVISKFDARTVYMVPAVGAGGVPTADSVSIFTLANTRLPTTVDARMNLFYATNATPGSAVRPFALFEEQGNANFSSNWINYFQNYKYPAPWGTMEVGVPFNGTGLGGLTASGAASPGFADFSAGNYLTTPTSPFASLSAAYPVAVTKRFLVPAVGAQPPVSPAGL